MSVARPNLANSATPLDSKTLHRDAIVIDGLNTSLPSRDLFILMQAGGLSAVHFTIAIWETFAEVAPVLVKWNTLFRENVDIVAPVQSVGDVRAAKLEGRIGIILGFQDTAPIQDQLGYVELFSRLGIRIAQLTYMYRNLAGCGCLEEDHGLSLFGKDLIRELNHNGIVIDLSHCGHRTTMEAIEVSEDPTVFSHVGVRTLCETRRNKTDDELKFVAEGGGVVGVVAFPTFLASNDATIADWFRHVDYLVDLLGPDHVAIGTDFVDGQPEGFADRGFFRNLTDEDQNPPWPWIYPEGLSSVADFPNITTGLIDRGYDKETIEKVLGGNLLRVYDRVWRRNSEARPQTGSPLAESLKYTEKGGRKTPRRGGAWNNSGQDSGGSG